MVGSQKLGAALHSLAHSVASKSGLDHYIDSHIIRQTEWSANAGQGTQVLLTMLYRDRAEAHRTLPSFDDVEFRAYSQNGEDGILLYLFALIGASNKKCVEICAGDGVQCNTANLIINHGWRGLLVDGDAEMVQSAKGFYGQNRSTYWLPPRIVHSWVTIESIDPLLDEYGFAGDIDLLSLDLDGIDYWIWKAMQSAKPRVVVAEFNWMWGPTEAKTVPYKADFTMPPDASPGYFGASLSALTTLARTKGMRLVGTQRWGFNAFFVRDGLAEDQLPEVSPEDCFDTPVMRTAWKPSFLDALATQEWISV